MSDLQVPVKEGAETTVQVFKGKTMYGATTEITLTERYIYQITGHRGRMQMLTIPVENIDSWGTIRKRYPVFLGFGLLMVIGGLIIANVNTFGMWMILVGIGSILLWAVWSRANGFVFSKSGKGEITFVIDNDMTNQVNGLWENINYSMSRW